MKQCIITVLSILILVLITGVDTAVSDEKCEDVMLVVCKMSSEENKIEVYRISGSARYSQPSTGDDCAIAISNTLKEGFCLKDISVETGFYYKDKSDKDKSDNKTIKEKHIDTFFYYTLVKYASDDSEKKPKKPEAPGY